MINPFKTFSFQRTFFFSFLLFSMLLVTLLGVTSYYITNQEVLKETIHTRKLLLNEINKQLVSQMQDVEYDSLSISSNPKVIQYLQVPENSFERVQMNTEIIDLLSRLSYIKAGIHSVQLYSRNAQIGHYRFVNGIFPYSDIENSSWYGQIRDSDYTWVGAHHMEAKNDLSREESVISFARKVLSGSGQELGILIININLPFIQSIISDNETEENRFVLDTNNRLITKVAGKDAGAAERFGEELKTRFGRVLDGGHSVDYAILEADESFPKELLILNQQKTTGWTTIDVIAWDKLTQGSKRIQKVIVVTAAACILFAVGMAFLLSTQFVRPIRNLVRVMNQVKIGQLDVQIHNEYRNEFGTLNEQFNHMLNRVQDLLGEVNEQNRKKREAELQVLQEQINPHFIYNTLDMINWHAIDHGARDVSQMLSLLGKMLRIGLSRGVLFIPLRQEMEHLHCYIELQQIRYQNRIRFSVSVPGSVGHYAVPKLMIQPFVENSLIHGFRAANEGTIAIAVEQFGDDLVFTIVDDGQGMESGNSDNWDKASDKRKGSSGMRNVHERLQLYFGPNYGIRVNSSPEGGTTVVIQLPKVNFEHLNQQGGINNGEGGTH
jgi:two-component system sensor histidine kinase YesM